MAERSPAFRMRILIAISLAAALVIVSRFAFIMLSPGRTESASAQAPATAERGTIVDREGRIIALQTRLWSVTAWKPEIDNAIETGVLLGPVLDMDSNEISRMLSGGGTSRFLFIKRQVTPTQSDVVRELITEGLLPGIGLQEELGRHYPMKELAAPLIGHVGTDNIGLEGIEYAFNRVLAPGSIASDTDRIYGHSVHLTLDMNTQYLVERIAKEAWEEHLPDSMMILVMNAKTAEILSWVSLPSYDPNTFTDYKRSDWRNRPLTEAYEPGSVFKVFTWAAFLEKGGIKIEDIFNTTQGYEPDIF
ncbi:MAG: peptidoglycan glycosyltransferase, partial [Spirochaetaceae bacterium]|nr:peptidoglycan glycosyltransferase [Spirochaetaceae bacterium]